LSGRRANRRASLRDVDARLIAEGFIPIEFQECDFTL
jgi:hypothetical protein